MSEGRPLVGRLFVFLVEFTRPSTLAPGLLSFAPGQRSPDGPSGAESQQEVQMKELNGKAAMIEVFARQAVGVGVR